MESWSVETIFQIVQTIAVLFGIPLIAFRLGRGAEALKGMISEQGRTIKELKDEQKEFRSVLTRVAEQNVRLDNQGAQLSQMWRLIEDLRRGEGFILPLAPKQPSQSGG